MTEKKEILDSAAGKVAAKKSGAGNGRVREWMRRFAQKARAISRRMNWLVVFNIALLGVIVALLWILYGRVAAVTIRRPTKPAATIVIARSPEKLRAAVRTPKYVRPTNAKIIREKNASMKKIPAAVKAKKNILTLPLKTTIAASRQGAPRQTSRIAGDIVIDGHGRAVILKGVSEIDGNLFLQNMRRYTLPCGLRVTGNLSLRDVRLLKFCGPFSVGGNIYVSRDSAFGPLPKDATLGGQVIF
ncbi:MAG: hypothetical protein LBL46_00450 [Rickettsiales bacterium]|jgi:hypothetical protein|nr:hypothetical protein [Rickettsiales bacterium]